MDGPIPQVSVLSLADARALTDEERDARISERLEKARARQESEDAEDENSESAQRLIDGV